MGLFRKITGSTNSSKRSTGKTSKYISTSTSKYLTADKHKDYKRPTSTKPTSTSAIPTRRPSSRGGGSTTRRIFKSRGGVDSGTAKAPTPIIQMVGKPSVTQERKEEFKRRAYATAKSIPGMVARAVERIPGGAVQSIGTFAIAPHIRTGEYIETGRKGFRKATLEESMGRRLRGMPLEEQVGAGVGMVLGGPILAPSAPNLKGITPTTREISIAEQYPKGKFRARALVEADKIYPVEVRGKAGSIPGKPELTLAKGTAIIKESPKRAVGYKFKGAGLQTLKKGKLTESIFTGEVTKSKLITAKRIRTLKPDTKWFKGRGITERIGPKLWKSKTDMTVLKRQAEIGKGYGVQFTTKVDMPTYTFKGTTATKGLTKAQAITKTQVKQITSGVVETLKTSLPRKIRPGILFPPKLFTNIVTKTQEAEQFKPLGTSTKEPTLKLAPELSKLTGIKQVTKYQTFTPTTGELPKLKTKMVVSSRLKPKVKSISRSLTSLKTVQIGKVTPMQKITTITALAPPALKTMQLQRTAPKLSYYPPTVTPSIFPKGGGILFPPMLPFPDFPSGRKGPAYKTKSVTGYQPSLISLGELKYGKMPTYGLSIRTRPITSKWAKKMRGIIGKV